MADTEADVERLGAVMDDAERALDAALARNRTLTAAARSRRDDEMSELRATIDAKDRAIDSLRETLTATRRALESRVTVAEDALAVRDAELRRVEDRAAADRRDKREAESRANDEAAACARAREETRRAEAALEEAKEAARASEEATSAKEHLEMWRERDRLVVALREGEEREAALTRRLAEEQDARKETQRKLDKYRRRHARDKEALAIATAAGGRGRGRGRRRGRRSRRPRAATWRNVSTPNRRPARRPSVCFGRNSTVGRTWRRCSCRCGTWRCARTITRRRSPRFGRLAALRAAVGAGATTGAGAGTGTGTSAPTSPSKKKKKGFF